MKVSKLKIQNAKLDLLVNHLITKESFEYESHSEHMSILVGSEYYFRHGTQQAQNIIIKQLDDYVYIDVLAYAGLGLLPYDWGSYLDYVIRISLIIDDYCVDEGLRLERVE